MIRLSHFLIIICFCSTHQVYAQPTLTEKALLLIDFQEFYFEAGVSPLDGADKAVGKAAVLLDYFRKNKGLVVHVKHDYEPGGDIHTSVSPLDGEKVIVKKEVNAFLNTDLEAYLNEQGKRELIIAGMQTHMCLEAAVREARDLGFACTVVSDACATRDLSFEGKTIKAEDVHLSTLATLVRTYSRVMSLEEYLKLIEN